MERVSWEDCQEFLLKLNQMTGKKFRLPTEAEWEYAARGGTKSRSYSYSGSNNIDDVAWYYNNSKGKTHDVKTKHPNELGLYDMSGNVWEWCYDWFGTYGSRPQVNPTGPSTGSDHARRGGGCDDMSLLCSVFNRIDFTPGNRNYSLGLRLAL